MEFFAAFLKNREFRNRILVTATLLAVFRVGYWLSLPGISAGASIGNFSDFLATVAASDVSAGSVFGLGIMPYISASIVAQLLTQVLPSLQALQKEGESGRRKINEYVRYGTVFVSVGQSLFWSSVIMPDGGFSSRLALALIMTSGTMVLVWLGEQIDAFGVGSGVSLLIVAGILARAPSTLLGGVRPALEEGLRIGSETGLERYGAIASVFYLILCGIVAIGDTSRRIPLISAKGGRKGQQFLPLKLNQAGVMPVIFASSVLMIPALLLQYLSGMVDSSIVSWLAYAFGGSGTFYLLLYSLMIVFFSFFWTAVSFRPDEVASSLKDAGVFVPGFRPGGRTEEHIEKVMGRITLAGGVMLALLACLPMLVSRLGLVGSGAAFFGGTGLMIVVSVMLDLRQRARAYLPE